MRRQDPVDASFHPLPFRLFEFLVSQEIAADRRASLFRVTHDRHSASDGGPAPPIRILRNCAASICDSPSPKCRSWIKAAPREQACVRSVSPETNFIVLLSRLPNRTNGGGPNGRITFAP
jgi:hypothetical protein